MQLPHEAAEFSFRDFLAVQDRVKRMHFADRMRGPVLGIVPVGPHCNRLSVAHIELGIGTELLGQRLAYGQRIELGVSWRLRPMDIVVINNGCHAF